MSDRCLVLDCACCYALSKSTLLDAGDNGAEPERSLIIIPSNIRHNVAAKSLTHAIHALALVLGAALMIQDRALARRKVSEHLTKILKHTHSIGSTTDSSLRTAAQPLPYHLARLLAWYARTRPSGVTSRLASQSPVMVSVMRSCSIYSCHHHSPCSVR